MTASPDDPREGLALFDTVSPAVTLPRKGVPIGVALFGLACSGALLFWMLDARREARLDPGATRPAEADAGAFAAAPPLALPPAPPSPEPTIVERIIRLPGRPVDAPQPVYRPLAPAFLPPVPPVAPPPLRVQTASSEPALVVDLTPAEPGAAGTAGSAGSASDDTAVRATLIRNRGSLVPQGTLIAAVLETPIDSSKPGLARAIVSRDARSFDGSRILIPRGSRLIGEYQSDVAPGQRRVLVTWTRLIRPDGVAIRIGSPAADALGSAGVAGRVNTHFFERFANAVLQSALTVGVNLASQPRSGSVYVGIPAQAANVGQSLLPNANPSPTIKVKQGAEIAIFVARDLDFGGTVPRE
ncbi:TrbI/VirB10 family protein [Erythrobacter colymbi]|uniref:TrbI/VirB10 family protein n=1 Tax=Erythrobacter colymbi TaxID=1161202 RepID=UPI001F0AB332|nr:TrbI/VirB10 family protein [Erythrobacter colymbi]